MTMTAADVLEIVDLLEGVGVESWVDGGWGVDALLGELDQEQAAAGRRRPRQRAEQLTRKRQLRGRDCGQDGQDERVPTLIWNGYGEFVAGMYKDMKDEKLFM